MELESLDCRDGKHRSCSGKGFDLAQGQPIPCPCICHDYAHEDHIHVALVGMDWGVKTQRPPLPIAFFVIVSVIVTLTALGMFLAFGVWGVVASVAINATAIYLGATS